MSYFLSIPLPKDLPENWDGDKYVSPNGVEVGLTTQHGYNYLMKQVNNAQGAALALAQVLSSGRENLLDNWFFHNPVNRLDGYFVHADTEYYLDPELTLPDGVTTTATAAQYVNTTYGTVMVDGFTYYVPYRDLRRGYIHGTTYSYGFDRWYGRMCTEGKDLGNGALSIISTGYATEGYIRQPVVNCEVLAGRRVVLSVLVTAITGTAYLRLYKARTVDSVNPTLLTSVPLSAGLNWSGVTLTNDIGGSDYSYLLVSIEVATGASVNVSAVKLNLGALPTLAYQDTDDSWKLTEIPNKVIETVKCNGAPVVIGGQGMLVLPADIGVSTANVLAEAEVVE